MSTSTPQFERIIVDDVNVGDRVARTRNELFHPVKSIDEGPSTRRLHFDSEACPEPELVTYNDPSRKWCPGCHRADDTIADQGHGLSGGGIIRPRRTAKLWRLVEGEEQAPRYRVDLSLTIDVQGGATAEEVADGVRQYLEGEIEIPHGVAGAEYRILRGEPDAVEANGRRID